MGSGEMDKPRKDAKEPKTLTTPEESSSTPSGTANPDWPGFQAYSPMPPHGFIASSPQAHPYMWGVQPIMPPYGTPPHPYVAMYPHGGIYAHPSMPPGSYPFSPFAMPSANGVAEASANTPTSMEANGKVSEGKEKLPIKRSKGSLSSLNMITGKNHEAGKVSGGSVNGGHSKRSRGDLTPTREHLNVVRLLENKYAGHPPGDQVITTLEESSCPRKTVGIRYVFLHRGPRVCTKELLIDLTFF